jgi:hypothetical protein
VALRLLLAAPLMGFALPAVYFTVALTVSREPISAVVSRVNYRNLLIYKDF